MLNNSFLSQTATTVVFIDFSVSKYHTLQTGIVDGVETVILSPERDGIEEITQVLQQNPQVNSVYIVAQGSPGSWYLGNTHLSLDNLDKLQDYQSLITTEKIKQILLDNNNGGFESIFDRGNGIAFADLQGAQSNNYQGFTQTSFPIPQEATLSQAQIPLTQQNLANLFATTNGSLTKLSSDLATLFTGINSSSLQSTNLQSTNGLIANQSFLQITGDNVAIEATADTNPDQLLTDLQSLGLQQSFAFGRVISGVIPISELGNVAALSSLRLVRPVYQPITNVGSVTSQGDVAQRSSNARSIYPGVDGTGITVGVLSDSYNNRGGASADVASGDLPSGVIVLQDLASGGTDEGRAMLQIVSDVAPGAKLAFHTANGGQAAFANGIKNLAKPVANGGAGASVIVDDVFYFAEPYFQDGIVTQAVDQVAADGVVYFSSAGNQARQSYESAFVPGSSATVGGQNYTFQDFDPSGVVNNFQAITINGAFTPGLQWDQPFASASTTGVGSQNDLDMFLFASPSFTSTIYASSTSNNLNADPFEIFGVTGTATAYVAIGKRDSVGGANPTKIKYVDFSGRNNTYQFATNSSTSVGHNQSANGLGVAAASYQQTPAFGTNPAVAESFTSLGGTPILFDTAGNRLATPIIRNQPAITAPDGVDTTFFGQDSDGNGKPNFFGTSAAAPSAAGVAALIRQAAPSATNTQIYNALKNTAIDMNTPGYDLLTGYGLIQADAAIATLNYAPTNLTLSNNTIAENQAIGTAIGTFTTTDPDTGNTFTYSLVTGTGATDNSLFAITNNQLKTNSVFDYETQNSYSIRVRTTDQGGLSYEKQLTIGVNDLNEITGNPSINNGRTPIVGTAGSDHIIGGPGAKTITGGAGNDFFVFTDLRAVGQRITDFTVGTDKIVLTQLISSINYIGIDPIADQYMRFVAGTGSNTGSTFLQIDRDGILGSATFKNFLQVDNITTTQLNNVNNFVF
ncbi:Alkaline elastase YaB [Dolichospermum sp. UHCC 0315A]|uniref:DUF4347 domain-containing protein n=1 Tax=Dolichospermum sp. UHCC 0315A TaxID=1914871 RepID=UPI0011E6F30A|nr:DUF4347 domain-containing protein [Dolichospermum sp. UHCC 0315A]QEI40437.1 Alkaline elastase YaB [Dolichospermum sp. UHCC 0315A]